MEERGLVKELRGSYALVKVIRQGSGCEGCPGGALCKSTGDDEAVIEALNEAGAREGDTVKIVFRSLSYLKGIMLVYGLPAIMLVVGAVLGKELLSPLLPEKDPDALSALLGFVLFILSFILVKVISARIQKGQRYMPVIIEIIRG